MVSSGFCERFYRLDVAHTSPGFGLGLAIARRIAEVHGGLLTAQSEPGQGCVFTLCLPRLMNRQLMAHDADERLM